MTRWMTRLLATMLGCLLVACSGAQPEPAPTTATTVAAPAATSIRLSAETFPLTVTDAADREITLESAPRQVVFLAGTPLNIWYDLGGTAVGRPELTDNIKLVADHATEIMALPSVGMPYATDAEAVAALDPDLVIGIDGPQNAAAEAFQQLGINTVLVSVKTFAELQQTYHAFGVLSGNQEQAQQRLDQISGQRDDVLAKAPRQPVKVAILFLSNQSVALKLDNSIAGEMATSLGWTNIAADATPDNPGSETTPLDIEFLIANQPDHVLVTTMLADNDSAKAAIEEQFASNPAWESVDAVREGRVTHLPQQYFLFNAGPYYADALTYLAACIHPEVYGAPVAP